MKAIVLAAGRGTRVRPITHSIPKPMMPIVHQPVLELLIRHLARYDFTEIMVNTSYLASSIEDYFRDGSRFGVQMAYSFEGRYENGKLIDEPVGSAGAIRRIQEHSVFFNSTFLAMCGDALIDLDLRKMLEFHRRNNAVATIALLNVDPERVSNFGVAVADSSGRILEFQEKPKREEAKSTLVNTGIYLFEPEIIDRIPSNTTYDIGGQLFPDLIASGERIFGFNLPFQWLDIGNTVDYYAVFQKALKGELPTIAFPGVEIQKGIWMGLNVRCSFADCRLIPPIIIGGSATIEPDCTIVGPTYIGPGSFIESNATVEKSVIFDYTRVGSQAHVNGMMVCGNYCIDSSGEVIDLARSDVDGIIRDSRAQQATPSDNQESFLSLLKEMQDLRRIE